MRCLTYYFRKRLRNNPFSAAPAPNKRISRATGKIKFEPFIPAKFCPVFGKRWMALRVGREENIQHENPFRVGPGGRFRRHPAGADVRAAAGVFFRSIEVRGPALGVFPFALKVRACWWDNNTASMHFGPVMRVLVNG